MTAAPDTDRPERALMRAANACVTANAQPGASHHAGWLAAIRTGITAQGEARALAVAGPYVGALAPNPRSGALRAAAIRAINKDVLQARTPETGRRPSLGASLWRLARADGGTSVQDQLGALPLMNTDSAALVLDGLIGRCARAQVPVDFYDLATTLTWWGHGGGARATRRRTRLILDFYATTTHL